MLEFLILQLEKVSGSKIILTNPNWANLRGRILMTLQYPFDAPITLADLHYLTPVTHTKWAKKLKMDLKWKTFDRSLRLQ